MCQKPVILRVNNQVQSFCIFIHIANATIQLLAGVQYTLDSVVQELSKNPDRTFIYVEMAYFTRWWAEQTEAKRSLVS